MTAVGQEAMPVDGMTVGDAEMLKKKQRHKLQDGEARPLDIPHITTNFVPISQVMTSMALHTHAELQTVLETLPSINSDLARKRRLLEFLVKSRREYVKLYVLAKWASISPDISQCIDVVSWLAGQKNCFANVVNVLFSVERSLGGAKLRNPDIETALEVLKYGKPVHNSHGFISLDPLSPKTVQQTLQALNVLLSIRLALTEELPTEYRNYRIADGRVKFTVDNSYVVDLSVADDTVDARFFFVDFRMCFEGAPAVALSIKAKIEKVVNAMLADKPLAEVFGWLLRFTQNYKLSLINDQLAARSRGLWAGVMSHMYFPDKSLVVVQYWPARRGPRNAIRIGLSRDYQIVLQWQRDGRIIDQAETPTLSDDLDVEGLLNGIVNGHVRYLVDSTYKALKALIEEDDSETDSEESVSLISPYKLRIQLWDNKYIVFSVDPLSGRFYLQNPTQLVLSAERGLNELTEPLPQAAELLLKLRYLSLQEDIIQKAKSTGWIANNNIVLSSDDMKEHFDDPALLNVFSLRLPSWSLSWFLLVAVSRGQPPKWYMSRLEAKDKMWNVLYLQPVTIRLANTLGVPDYATFDNLSKFMTSRFIINGICQDLDARDAKYSLLLASDSEGSKLPTILINLPSLMGETTESSTWAHNSLLVTLHGDDTAVAQGRTRNGLTLNEVSTPKPESGVLLDPVSGRFMLQLQLSKSGNGTVKKGDLEVSFVETALEQLLRIERMVSYVNQVKSMSLDLREASMDRIVFEYGSGLSATIFLDSETPSGADSEGKSGGGIRLELSKGNPHNRVRAALQEMLSNQGLVGVVWLLRMTRPMYEALEKLEAGSEPIVVVPRSVGEVCIAYPRRKTSLCLTLVRRRKRYVMYVKEEEPVLPLRMPDGRPLPPIPDTKLQASGIWKQPFPGHPDIVPLVKGAVAPVEKVSTVLSRAHSVLIDEQVDL